MPSERAENPRGGGSADRFRQKSRTRTTSSCCLKICSPSARSAKPRSASPLRASSTPAIRNASSREGHGGVGNHHRPRVEMPGLRRRRLHHGRSIILATTPAREVNSERRAGPRFFRRALCGGGVIGVRCRAPCAPLVILVRTLRPIPCSALVMNPPTACQFRNPSIRRRRSPPSSFEGGGLFVLANRALCNLQPFEPITPDIARMPSSIDLLPGSGFIRALRPA